MHCLTLLSVILLLVSAALPGLAKAQQAEQMEITESGKGYLQSVGRRVNSNVAYYDPNRAAPELTTNARPEDRAERREVTPTRIPDHVFTAIAALVLIAVAIHIWRSGAAVSVSLRKRPGNAARDLRRSGSVDDDGAAEALQLSEILRMEDRNLALVELARRVLTDVAQQNGMHWQSSWTARDLLRRLPRDLREAMRPLVQVAEHVQFGDRHVAEEEFTFFAERARGLIQGAPQ